MTVLKTAGSLAVEAVGTAVSAALHPISTVAWAGGVAKGTVGLGVDVVRVVVGQPAPPRTATGERWREAAEAEANGDVAEAPEVQDTEDTSAASATPRADAAARERADLPGPDVVARAVPEIDELPEPIVIEAEPAGSTADAETGEAFHTEPKAASRDSAHGGPAGDREEADGYLEEIDGDDAPEPGDPTLPLP